MVNERLHPGIQLPPGALDEIFPFHFVFGPDWQIRGCGRSLARVCPRVVPGARFIDLFNPVRPESPFTFATLVEARQSLFLIREITTGVLLRGQMLPLQPSEEAVVFLGSPWVTESPLSNYGLSFDDFAIHDPAMDLLQLLQAQKMAAADLQKLAQRLQVQRTALTEANQELARSQSVLTDTLRQLQASHAELQQTQLQLIQAAKLESVGSLAAGVAHEVKNPLQTILMGVGYLANRRPPPDADMALALDDMREAVQRANRIIRELLELSAATQFDLKDEDLNEVVERSLWLVNHELVAARLKVIRQLQRPLEPVAMDRSKIEQVLLNLLINAIQAMTPGQTLTVATRSGCLGQGLDLPRGAGSAFQPGETLVVAEVRDTGPGIPAAQLARVFEPFFTTKPVGVGTGLGLSVAKKIIDLHDGSIDIQNAPEGGLCVTLVFRAQARKSL